MPPLVVVQALENLKQVLNGDWRKGGCLIHHCHSAGCCGGYQVSITKARTISALIGVLLHVAPPVPSANKWTKLGPTLDFFLPGVLCHGILTVIYEKAFAKQQSKPSQPGQEAADTGDQCFIEAVNWHAVQGKRYKAGLTFLRHPLMHVETTVLAIALEPVRYVTRWLMKTCSRQQCPSRVPALISLASGVESPLKLVLQYISGLLAGESSRLRLLVEGSGCDSVEEWVGTCSEAAQLLRRVLMATASWLHRRLEHYTQSYPWRLAALADQRLSNSERAEIASTFLSKNKCDLDPYFSCRLKERVTGLSDLLVPHRWPSVLRHWAQQVSCSICDVEFRHAQNRKMASEGMAWPHFTAAYVLSEAKNLASLDIGGARRRAAPIGDDRLGAVAEPDQQMPSPPLPPLGDHQPQRGAGTGSYYKTRASTPLDLFRQELIAEDQKAGRKFNPCSREYWAKVHKEYADMQSTKPEQYAKLVERSGCTTTTRPLLKARKKLQKQKIQAPAPQLPHQPLALPLPPVEPEATIVKSLAVDSAAAPTEALVSTWLGGADVGALELSESLVVAEPQGDTLSKKPLSMEKFHAFVDPSTDTGFKNIRSRVADFKRQHRRVGAVKATWPTIVQPKPCGCLCGQVYSDRTRGMKDAVVETIRKYLNSGGMPNTVVKNQPLVCFEVHTVSERGPEVTNTFASLASNSKQAGPLLPRENWVKCQATAAGPSAEGDQYRGVIVKHSRLAHNPRQDPRAV